METKKSCQKDVKRRPKATVIQMITFLSGNGKVCHTVNSCQNMYSCTCTVVLLFTWLKSLMSCLFCKLYTLLFTPGSNIFTHDVMSPVNASGETRPLRLYQDTCQVKHIYLLLEVEIHSRLLREKTEFFFCLLNMYPFTCLVISLLGEE